MRKVFPIFLALIAVVLYGCSGGSSSQDSSSQESASQEATEVGKLIPEEDSRPPIVLKGEGYQLELPAFATDVQCEPVSEVREFDLMWQGHDLIVKPISVTRNGDNHVQLGQPATVRFAIPEDVPEDQYDELVGMLFTDHGTEYKIPDYYALREGFVQFETSHFCDLAAGRQRDSLREVFIEEVAVNGWGRNMSNKDMEPTLRAQINKFAEDHCMGENDLVGIAMREVFGEKDFVKIGLDIVNAYDMENASLEERMAVASETMIKLAKGKVLSYLIKKLKVDENKKVKVLDEMKSEKIGEFVYKTEIEKIDSRRNKVVSVLEDHFSMENAEKVGTVLGDNPTFEQCYIYACQYIGNFALEKWKETLIEMIPYLGYLKHMATAIEIWKKFWAATQMQDLYREYERKANAKGELLKDDEWDQITWYVNAPKFWHGMTEKQMREYIEQRYLEKKEIEERKVALKRYIGLIEENVDLKSECFEQKHFDYVQRLTVVNNLIDRFYDELVGDDGYLTYVDNGYKQALCTPFEIDRQLCYVANEYLKCYPNREKFYAWLKENGYHFGNLEDEYNRLDKLLWNDKPKKDPDVHIVIQETMGASSGIPKYMNHTICLAKDGKPYKEWYRTIPKNDSIRYYGWKTEYPAEDEYIKLSDYKDMGAPNQVFVYANEKDFIAGRAPVKTVPFEVDTTNSYTIIELNEDTGEMREFVFANSSDWNAYIGYRNGYYYDIKTKAYVEEWNDTVAIGALYDALANVQLYLKYPKDNFSFTTSGDCINEDGNATAHIDMTVKGEVDFKKVMCHATMSGTCTVTDDRSGEKFIVHFNNLTSETSTSESPLGCYFCCYPEGQFEIEYSNRQKGKSYTVKSNGKAQFYFKMPSKYDEYE